MAFIKKSLISLLIAVSLLGCKPKIEKDSTSNEVKKILMNIYPEGKAPIVVGRGNGKDTVFYPYELSDSYNKISKIYFSDDGEAYYFNGKTYRELPKKR